MNNTEAVKAFYQYMCVMNAALAPKYFFTSSIRGYQAQFSRRTHTVLHPHRLPE
jgi:hypothetical protein